jgi:hypothetical protein
VASERVISWRGEGAEGSFCFRVASWVVVPTLAAHLICAGQSHGSVNCAESLRSGEGNASLRSFRRAARASIVTGASPRGYIIVKCKKKKQTIHKFNQKGQITRTSGGRESLDGEH